MSSSSSVPRTTPYKYLPLPTRSIRLLTLLPGAPRSDIHITLTSHPLSSCPSYEALSYEWGLPSTFTIPNVHDDGKSKDGNLKVSIQLQREIYCDGKSLVVTRNLGGILEELRRQWMDGQRMGGLKGLGEGGREDLDGGTREGIGQAKGRVLWIDGICINQSDVDERREQVLLMRGIYEGVGGVVMWIGQPKARTGRVFGVVRSLARAYDSRTFEPGDEGKKGFLGRIVMDGELLEELKGEIWEDVVDVFTRPYFGRVWVVQEIVMARRAEVKCGRFGVAWEEMYKAMTLIFMLGLVVDKDPHEVPPEARVKGTHVVVKLEEAKEEDKSENRRLWGRMESIGEVWNSRHGRLPELERYRYSLASLTGAFLGHEVTDPRDRVYGMLGMAEPEGMYGKRNAIQPDYTKSVIDVYRDACVWAIRDSGSLAMLDQCDAPSTNKLEGLPSWVPDLTSGVRRCRLVTDLLRQQSFGPPLFPPLSTLFKDHFRAEVSGDVLKVRGTIIDTVEMVTLPCTSMTKHIICMEAFANFCLDNAPYPTGGTRLDAVWRTFLTNYVTTGQTVGDMRIAPPEYGGHFVSNMTGNFRYQLGLPDHLTGDMPDINTLYPNGNWSLRRMCPRDVEDNISILALMAKHPFFQYLYDHRDDGDEEEWQREFGEKEYVAYGDEGRQFVVTQKGYMGLGPRCPSLGYEGDSFVVRKGSYVKRRDVVAVLSGSDKVWFLRMEGGKKYKIVGHGYVHGVMEGEWFKGRTPVMEEVELC